MSQQYPPHDDDATRQISAVADDSEAAYPSTIWDHEPQQRRSRRKNSASRWVLPIATVLLLGAGVFVLGAGLGTLLFNPEPDPAEEAWQNIAVPNVPSQAEVTSATEESDRNPGVSDLVDEAWVDKVSQESNIAPQALAAYAGASLLANETAPQCNLGWNTLAAIGDVETEHGTFGGSRISDDGVVSPTIVGPALDGSEGVAEVADTDGGVLDGDTEWDRAVGPMQFIPATWESFGQDGSGDGQIDINNIEDASLAAAIFLCVHGDMTVEEDWISAIDAYNPSVDYNLQVAERARHYGNFG